MNATTFEKPSSTHATLVEDDLDLSAWVAELRAARNPSLVKSFLIGIGGMLVALAVLIVWSRAL